MVRQVARHFVLLAGVLVETEQGLLDVDVDFFAERLQDRSVQAVEDRVQDKME